MILSKASIPVTLEAAMVHSAQGPQLVRVESPETSTCGVIPHQTSSLVAIGALHLCVIPIAAAICRGPSDSVGFSLKLLPGPVLQHGFSMAGQDPTGPKRVQKGSHGSPGACVTFDQVLVAGAGGFSCRLLHIPMLSSETSQSSSMRSALMFEIFVRTRVEIGTSDVGASTSGKSHMAESSTDALM